MKHIDKSTRLSNYIIDILVIYILWIIVSLFTNTGYLNVFLLSAIMFLYYFLFEALTSQTLGKLITKTKVVNKDGSKPHVISILIRSISRLFPLDWLSYMFGNDIGMHDLFSNTILTKKN
ncbi:RDD family protein [uncultured Psychroserpens sp.]|uniref:RDD family protein n=1 Tax=uncultured Psychroserpens sp. TaxID=255436 RepID=UPI002627B5CE|nr:RDD family protein [uncultured Psychroserpens sp.]